MGRAPRVERLLLYDWTSQAPQSALLSLDRVSEVKGGRLGWWFLQRSREKDERDWEGMQWGGSVEVAARKRPNCTSQAISHFKEGGMPGGGLSQVESEDEAVARSGSHPAFPVSLLVWLPPFWVQWRGHHGFPPFPSLLFVRKLPKTDLEGWRVGRALWKG